MSKPTIVFVNPVISIEGGGDFKLKKEVSVPPEGLCSLAAVTREAGYPTHIIDAPALGMTHQSSLGAILAYDPSYVGITAVTITANDAAKLAEMIKKENPEITTILGGPHITVLPEETMRRYPQFDIGVMGEGEVTIVELLKALEGKAHHRSHHRYLKEVKGLIFSDGDQLYTTQARPFIKNLDDLPMPAWDLLPDLREHYQQSVARAKRLPAMSLITSRGCPGKCIFCARPVFGNRLRAFSADRVMAMIHKLMDDYGMRSLVINDDNFVVFRRRLKQLCAQIISEKLDLTWSCFSRVDNVNPEILNLMREAGCTDVAFGIESGCQEILDFAQKGITLQQIRGAVKLAKEAGLKVTGYFIIGFPGETRETMKQTIEFAKDLPLDDFLLSYMVAYPGSRLYEIADEYGEFDRNWEKMNQWSINFVPHGLTGDDLEECFNSAFREFYLRPRVLMSHLKRAACLSSMGRYVREGVRMLKFSLTGTGA